VSEFNLAFDDALKHEGGFVNHALDKGGATAFGISLRFLQTLPVSAGDVTGDGHVDIKDILALTPDSARAYYRRYFWDHYRLSAIRDQRVATKLFNFFVNMRGTTATLIAQRSANDLGANLTEDGIIGSRTRSALNGMDADQLMVCIKWQAWRVYRAIVDNDPSQAAFINGWRVRAFADV